MRRHLKRVVDLEIPIYAIYNKGIGRISGGRFYYDAELVLATGKRSDLPSAGDNIAFSYSIDSFICTFETKVTSVKDAGKES